MVPSAHISPTSLPVQPSPRRVKPRSRARSDHLRFQTSLTCEASQHLHKQTTRAHKTPPPLTLTGSCCHWEQRGNPVSLTLYRQNYRWKNSHELLLLGSRAGASRRTPAGLRMACPQGLLWARRAPLSLGEFRTGAHVCPRSPETQELELKVSQTHGPGARAPRANGDG